MEAVLSTIQTIFAIAMVTVTGALVIFMGYAIVHLTCNNKNREDEK